MGDDAADAAEAAVDQDRLLDGEAVDTTDPEEAAHWAAVYRELVAFKADILTRTEERAAGMPGSAAREVQATDLPVLRAEASRLRRRLEFWARRSGELER